MNALPDVNFWLALLLRKHAGHAAARAWWEQHPEVIGYFSRVTEMGVLRGLTNRAIARVTGLTETNVGTILHRTIQDLRDGWNKGA